jgi:electron transfer flavoprotein alpha subunit
MSEVLVLVDHAEGVVKKPTYELLTLARRLGEPSAVFIGTADAAAAAKDNLARYGAEKVYVVDDADIKGFLVAPKAEALAQLVEKVGEGGPAAVLISSTPEGKEVAARLAIKTSSGLITDAVDIAEGGITTQSVFAGNYTVTAKVTQGTPVISVKPNAATPQEHTGAGAVEEFAATISEAARTAQIVASQPREKSGRPELTEAAIVVSGGRGTGGEFAPIEALADALGAALLPGRADRQDRLPPAVRGRRHLRRHPAPRRHADLQDHRRGQQGRRGPHLRARRPRRRRRPPHRPARRHRGHPPPQGLILAPPWRK